MPTTGTVTTVALSIASFLALAIVTALISANVRRWANDKGHDGYLLWISNHTPVWASKMLAGWKPLRQLWWLWLALDASGGLGTALWLLAGPMPSAVPTHPVGPAQPSVQSPVIVTPPGDALSDSIRRLPVADKERLSNMFFDASQLLDEGNEVFDKANILGANVRNSMVSDISVTIEQYKSRASDLVSISKTYRMKYEHLESKWSYYADFITYILDGNENDMLTIENGAESLNNDLSFWSQIENKATPDVAKLLFSALLIFDEYTNKFHAWRAGADQRLMQLKAALK